MAANNTVDARQYFEDHDIEGQLTACAQKLAVELPEDPYEVQMPTQRIRPPITIAIL